ncbi:MAG: hypothetical protein ACD_43C00201G0002 [uncultured bacterium]|nr:MAG: hypothetical protein ACD_43C00201G0002 [uncultured bacterium]
MNILYTEIVDNISPDPRLISPMSAELRTDK